MTLEQTITLLEAGYTKEEILALDTPASADPEPAPADPEPAPADPEPAPADPEPAPAQSDALRDVLKELAAVKVTLKGLQANNIRTAGGGKEEPLTADKVISDFFGQSAK